jgi:hypothetical protein
MIRRTIALALLPLAAAASFSACADEEARAPEKITYAEHIAPLVEQHCSGCHQPGGLGPFSLTSYEDLKDYGPIAVGRVRERSMPPWGAFETDECKPRLHFRDDMRLSDAEIELFGKWVDTGMARGDTHRAVATSRQVVTRNIPDPTDTIAPSTPFMVPGGGPDQFRCFVVDPKITDTTFLTAANVVPGNSKVVHHVIVFADEARESLEKAGPDGSYECFGGPGLGRTNLVMAWAPGVPPAEYGNDVAMMIRKDTLLVIQVHYHPIEGEPQEDHTHIELRRSPEMPTWFAVLQLIGNAVEPYVKLLPGPNDSTSKPEFVIPANVSNHQEKMEFVLPPVFEGDAIPELKIAAVGTHMHWVGRDMRMELERGSERPGQPKNECLVETPQWDFNWQRGYVYDAPIEELPTFMPGDKLKLTCSYDNTMRNPAVRKALEEKHLTKPTDVRLGEETLDEMCLGALVLLYKNPFKLR